jgi:colicin import membrane protein
LRARFAQTDAQHARELAPDLYARAERAWQDAKRATEPDAALDHETRARLLLAAAVAEAERIVLDRAASAAEARYTEALEQRAELERTRVELEQAAARDRAALDARAEAARVFQRAEPAQRGAHGAAERDAQRASDAEVVRRHALLMLAAADALGLSGERSNQLALTIAAAEHAANGAAALEAAHAALAAVERALGDARKARGAIPTQAEIAALVALAQERGLEAQASPQGVVVALDGVFATGSAQLTAVGRPKLDQAAALARAHPHGSIEIVVPAGAHAAGARSIAGARAERIARILRTATDPARLQAQFPTAIERSADHVQLVFAAYGGDAKAKVPPQPIATLAQP